MQSDTKQENKTKLGLVLEGGGARGAYQNGALKAMIESGYKFDGVAGTSVGALNGVMIAQDRFDRCCAVWEDMEFSKCFAVSDEYANKLAKGKYDLDTIKYFAGFLADAIRSKGVNTDRLKGIIRSNIDEDVLRSSGIDFGVMTVSVSEKKPCPVFVEDMPYGTVADYVMASATFPGFQKTVVGDNTYVDGGFYDNMPVNMLIDRGYRDIIAIETKSFIPKKKPREHIAQIYYIRPSEKPGRSMDFTPESKNRAINIGYYDTLKLLKGYKGFRYYLDMSDRSPFGYGLCDLPYAVYYKISMILGEEYTNEQELVKIFNKTFKMSHKNIADCLIDIAERVATAGGVERLNVYTFDEFFALIAKCLKKLFKLEEYQKGKFYQELEIIGVLLDYLK